MTTKVIYVHSDWEEEDLESLRNLSNAKDRLEFAQKSDCMTVYSCLSAFEMAFNNDLVSDCGYIFFVYESD